MTSSAIQRYANIAFFIGLSALLAWVSIQYTVKVLTPRQDGHTQSAILRWSKQIQAMEDGENIHARYNYPNPPVMAHLLWPLSELAQSSPLAAALTWFYLKVLMALACVLWAFRMVRDPDRPFPAWAMGLTVILSIRPILGDLSHGNINIFILFLVMASLYSFSRGRDRLSGVLLALAIACKVTPALFVVYFLWKRSWGTLAGCAVGLVLFFLVVPSAIFAAQEGSLAAGWNRNWEALAGWKKSMIDPYLIHGIVTPEKENQSLPGVLTRLLTHSPSFSTWVDEIYTPLAYHNMADLGRDAVKRIVQVCQFAFLVLMVLVCRAPIRAPGVPSVEVRRGWRLAAEFSLILVAMLLFSERTWKHHCVTLLLPFAVLCFGMTHWFTIRQRRVAVATATVAGLLMLATSSGLFGNETPKVSRDFAGMTVAVGPTVFIGAIESEMTTRVGLVPDSPGKFAQVYGAYVGAFLALLAGLSALVALRQSGPAGDPQPPP